MTSIKSAVSKTLKYAAHFDYPLTLKELHYWLITSEPVPFLSLKRILSKKSLTKLEKISPKRQQRLVLTNQKLAHLNPLLKVLTLIPTINLVAVTGSLSMNNARPSADIDLFIITTSNTLWLTRPLVLLLTSLLSKRRHPLSSHQPDSVCINLWLDHLALEVPSQKQNLYIAHEVLQIRPLLNRNNAYENFIKTNSWTSQYLANAYQIITSSFLSSKSNSSRGKFSFILKQVNNFFFKLQYLYMSSKITNEYITLHQAYFHPRDFSVDINQNLTNKS